jgi:hypothetical protein
METRTDEHRPSVINPEDYEFVAVEYQKLDEDIACMFLADQQRFIRAHMKITGGDYSTHKHGGNCHICGAWCIYTAIFYHEKSNSYIRTGFDCAEKMHMGNATLFRSCRNAVKDAREAKAGKMKAQAILSDAGLEKAWDIYSTDDLNTVDQGIFKAYITVRDIIGKLVAYGEITDNQIDFVKKLLDKINLWPEEKIRREKERETAQDCPAGRVEITGTILKTEEKTYGEDIRLVMTVKDDRGFLVWGTIPTNIVDASHGNRVCFSATVTPSDRDKKFGFYKFPKKAKIIA